MCLHVGDDAPLGVPVIEETQEELIYTQNFVHKLRELPPGTELMYKI